jgi:hypothetical protein
MNSVFVNDALEGLQRFNDKEKLDQYVNDLNKNLHQQLAARKQRKQKRKFKDDPWLLLTIIIILALCILGYIVIHLHNKAAH